MKRAAAVLMAIILLLSGCSRTPDKRSRSWYGAFDTVVTLSSYCDEESFSRAARCVDEILTSLDALYDPYAVSGDVHGIAYLNEWAGKSPVTVPEELFTLIGHCLSAQDSYPGVNIAMGSVTGLWHSARESGVLPDESALASAGAHMRPESVLLDETQRTVFFTDPLVKLDLGCAAKGRAANLIAEALSEAGLTNFLLSMGGSSAVAKGREWTIGVQDPAAEYGANLLATLRLSGGAVSTSGDYLRTFTVNGVRYHHIIDPETLYPSTGSHAATVIAEDSVTADLLSTSLLILPPDDALALVESLPGVECLLVTEDGVLLSGGMSRYVGGTP